MAAHVIPAARLVACRPLRAARYGRIDDLSATLAGQLLERQPLTGRTMARMTRSIAFMLAAAQLRRTGQRAHVVNVDTALEIALVFAAATLFRTLFLAPGIVCPGGQHFALYLLVHVPATTLDGRRL